MAGKIEAYVGFCLKARKIVLGSGSIEVQKKGVHLIMVCSSAADNTFKLAIKFSKKFSCPLMVCKTGLENTVHKQGCKIAAVKDENLAKVIIENCNDDFVIYTER